MIRYPITNGLQNAKLILITSFLGLGFFSNLNGQSSTAYTDSLISALAIADSDSAKYLIYRNLIWAHISANPEQAIRHNDDFMRIATRANRLTWKNLARYYYGVAYRHIGEPVKSLAYLDTTLQFYEIQEDTLRQAFTLFQMGVVKPLLGQFDDAIADLNECVTIYNQYGRTRDAADCVVAKGSIWRSIGQFEKAQEAYRESHALYSSIQDTIGLLDVFLNMANVFKQTNQFDSAKLYLVRYEQIPLVQSDAYSLGFLYESRGDLLRRMERYEEAKGNLIKSIELRKKLGLKAMASAALSMLSEVELMLLEINQAETHAREALELAQAHQMVELQKTGHLQLAKILEARKKWIDAIAHRKEYDRLKDSLYNSQTSKYMASMEALHQTKQKEEQIAQMEFNSQLVSAKLSKQRGWILFISVAGFILLFLAWRMYHMYQRIEKQNATIKHNLSEKETLLQEIHHRVKNNLQVISSLLSLQSMTVKDQSAINALTEGQSRVQSMALIHQDLYRSENLTSLDVSNYITKLCENLFNTYNTSQDQVRLQLDIQPIALDVSTLIPLGLVLNELISNSLKYAFPNRRDGILGVQLKEMDDHLYLEVRDNGIGFSAAEQQQGFGHRLIRNFAKKLKANVSIQNHKGTIVSLDIHNYKVA